MVKSKFLSVSSMNTLLAILKVTDARRDVILAGGLCQRFPWRHLSPSPTWNGYETRQTLLLYVFVDLTVQSVQFSIPAVYMATLGSNQSESRKDNGAIVFGSCVSLAWDTSSIFHVTHFDQSESSKGFACLDTRPSQSS